MMAIIFDPNQEIVEITPSYTEEEAILRISQNNK